MNKKESTQQDDTHDPGYDAGGADPQTLFQEAVRHHGQGNYAQAERLYFLVLQMLPDNVNVLANLGVLYKEQNRLEEAQKCCIRAVAAAPDNASAHLNYGTVLEALHNPGAAVQSYRRALQVEPGNPKALNNLGKALYQQGEMEEALDCLQKAVAIFPGYAFALNNLGMIYHSLGDSGKAEECFKRCLSINDSDVGVLYNLAGVYNAEGRTEEAIAAFRRVLKAAPGHPSASHMLSALSGRTTESAPRQYVEETFDRYAANFDSHLLEKLEYDVPALLRTALDACIAGGGTLRKALDLGCGTGLSGKAFRSLAASLTGVDVSSQMLEKAKAKMIYDRLYQEDITDFLQRSRESFDLFIATDVFIYVGRLEAVFEGIHGCVAPKGWFVFSTENCEGQDCVLRPSGRYAHAVQYIETLAARYGFLVVDRQECNIRKEQDQRIAGNIFVLQAG